MNKLNIRTLFLTLFIIPNLLFAQDDVPEIELKKFSIGLVPQYSLLGGMRTDLDIRLNEKNHWLVVSPLIFYDDGNIGYSDYEEMFGVGLELQHRIYLHKNDPQPRGAYFGYGTVFNYYSVESNGYQSYLFDENGNDYIGLEYGPVNTNIFKFGGNFVFGLQTVINDFFYLDAYIGTGIRLSVDNKTSGLHKYYTDSWLDLGYSGTLLVGGLRLGISF